MRLFRGSRRGKLEIDDEVRNELIKDSLRARERRRKEQEAAEKAKTGAESRSNPGSSKVEDASSQADAGPSTRPSTDSQSVPSNDPVFLHKVESEARIEPQLVTENDGSRTSSGSSSVVVRTADIPLEFLGAEARAELDPDDLLMIPVSIHPVVFNRSMSPLAALERRLAIPLEKITPKHLFKRLERRTPETPTATGSSQNAESCNADKEALPTELKAGSSNIRNSVSMMVVQGNKHSINQPNTEEIVSSSGAGGVSKERQPLLPELSFDPAKNDELSAAIASIGRANRNSLVFVTCLPEKNAEQDTSSSSVPETSVRRQASPRPSTETVRTVTARRTIAEPTVRVEAPPGAPADTSRASLPEFCQPTVTLDFSIDYSDSPESPEPSDFGWTSDEPGEETDDEDAHSVMTVKGVPHVNNTSGTRDEDEVSKLSDQDGRDMRDADAVSELSEQDANEMRAEEEFSGPSAREEASDDTQNGAHELQGSMSLSVSEVSLSGYDDFYMGRLETASIAESFDTALPDSPGMRGMLDMFPKPRNRGLPDVSITDMSFEGDTANLPAAPLSIRRRPSTSVTTELDGTELPDSALPDSTLSNPAFDEDTDSLYPVLLDVCRRGTASTTDLDLSALPDWVLDDTQSLVPAPLKIRHSSTQHGADLNKSALTDTPKAGFDKRVSSDWVSDDIGSLIPTPLKSRRLSAKHHAEPDKPALTDTPVDDDTANLILASPNIRHPSTKHHVDSAMPALPDLANRPLPETPKAESDKPAVPNRASDDDTARLSPASPNIQPREMTPTAESAKNSLPKPSGKQATYSLFPTPPKATPTRVIPNAGMVRNTSSPDLPSPPGPPPAGPAPLPSTPSSRSASAPVRRPVSRSSRVDGPSERGTQLTVNEFLIESHKASKLFEDEVEPSPPSSPSMLDDEYSFLTPRRAPAPPISPAIQVVFSRNMLASGRQGSPLTPSPLRSSSSAGDLRDTPSPTSDYHDFDFDRNEDSPRTSSRLAPVAAPRLVTSTQHPLMQFNRSVTMPNISDAPDESLRTM